MKKTICLLCGAVLLLTSCHVSRQEKKHQKFSLHYTASDENRASELRDALLEGEKIIETFWQRPFPHSFKVVVHPNRAALDSCWQGAWSMPEFHSECWMVAGGVAQQLDLLSPQVWTSEACEHRWEDHTATVRLLAHEMAHVYHGQHNPSPDFSEVQGLDWFVEGLAVYASGQCDSARMAGVQHWLQKNPVPVSLDHFWKGKHKYGLSGSMVMFLDRQAGRKKLAQLMKYTQKEALLNDIETTEQELISAWKDWMAAGAGRK